MRTINNKSKVGASILALSLLLGVGIISSMTAQAQDPNGQWQRRDRQRGDDDDDQNQDWRRNDRRHGDRDQNRSRRDDRYQRDDVYQNDGSYYPNRGYGNRGYNNGNQIEISQGYQAGLNTGASDAQRGQSYSPQRSHYYRNASSQQFRNAFVQGYDAGYQQYGGYNNNGGYRRGNSGRGIGSVLGIILGGR